ncbi:hypothetical protein BS47DRAFT_31168 [Hydnum rufescens UP504]|uniref:Uncharacterized protein n=1 Tax=Hydnum rufescens UP504 TaxID=1448309 RepID=A0A9P6B8W0_9AGAM|nr:hypothetical protein BS47DRAFT_31168 [Hydnum rufescens UP504]
MGEKHSYLGGLEPGIILGGCIAQECLTYHVLYSWLRAIFRVHLQTFPTGEREAWYLVHCHPGSSTQLPIVDDMWPIMPSGNRVSEGHYVVKLFIHLQPRIAPTFRGDIDVELRRFNSRNRLPSRASSSNGTPDSASGNHRHWGFRHSVRKRDGLCRLSGTRPGYTCDGLNRVINLNYTGFQAAHIFPLAFAHRAEAAWTSWCRDTLRDL